MDNSRKKTAVVQQHPVASSSATKQHIGLWAVVVCMAMLTTSCLSFDKLMKSTDYEAKYKAAQQYYNDGSYSKASQLLETCSYTCGTSSSRRTSCGSTPKAFTR